MLDSFNRVGASMSRAGNELLPLAARFVFAAVLLMYFWQSGLTKISDGFFGFLTPSLGAYAQIFPKAMESVGYDVSQMTFFHTLVVLGGTWAEFILPLFIVIGLLTRLSALGMIGFIVVQSLTDLFAHGGAADEKVFGSWFDAASDSLILDQRAFWVLGLLILVFKGAGSLSFDRAINGMLGHQADAQQ